MVGWMMVLVAVLSNPCPPASQWSGGRYIGPGGAQSREALRDSYGDRYRAALKSLGLDKEARDVAVTLAFNESRMDACAVHKLGPNEWGRGMAGHMVRLHFADKWGEGYEEMLHLPEVAAVMVARTMRRWRKRTWLRVHLAHAGRRPQWAVDRFCRRLKKRGIDCRAPVSELGTKLGKRPHPDQGAWLWRMLWDSTVSP